MTTGRRYRRGDIVKVVLEEARGKGKVRWMVVLSDLQVEAGRGFYFCAAISTTFPEPAPAVNVEIPWDPSGRACTGLRKRSAVVLDWVREMVIGKWLNG